MGWFIVDILIIIWLINTGFEGFKKGFFRSFFELIGFVASILIGLLFYSVPAVFFRYVFGITIGVANLFSFTLIFLTSLLIYFAIADPVSNIIKTKAPGLSEKLWYKLLGTITETIKGIALLSLIVATVYFFPLNKTIKDSVERSYLGVSFARSGGIVQQDLENILGKAMHEGNMLSASFIKGRLDEPFKPGKPPKKLMKISAKDESSMLDLINEERRKRGLVQLKMDNGLKKLARSHSTEMFNKNYFSHTSPVAGSYQKRLENYKIDYSIAGENLAFAPDVYVAHRGLMRSRYHRENILNPLFRKAGIGIIDAEIYEMMFTQNFTN